VCTPELALTGYVSERGDFDMRAWAEPLDGRSAQALARLAVKHRVTLSSAIVEQAGEAYFNTTLVFSDAGKRIACYRKRHPWYPETWATPGAEMHPIFAWAEKRVTIAVCFDVHFLREEAEDVLRAADVLVFPSAWVEDGVDSRDSLLPALAQDFDLNVVNPNWGPGVPRVQTQGRSRIVTRDGQTLEGAKTVYVLK
jgi:5-aminopentanamidase